MAAPLPRSRYTSSAVDMSDVKFLFPQTDNVVWKDKYIERIANEIDGIKTDIKDSRSEMQEEFKNVHTEIKDVRAEVKDLRTEIKTIDRHVQTLFVAMIVGIVTVVVSSIFK